MASNKPITKKVLNSPDTCVDDNLRGVVALYPNLHLHPKHRVVTLRRKTDSGRVAVLSGGGSGHEPFAAGFIGNGMLSGAVAGGVFASPPTANVLYAIAQLYKYNSGGVLVFCGNYTGDRLNFGKATEKAKIAGIKTELFFVGEDVASSTNKTGGRGMCGEVFLFKMLGAMSAKGYDLSSMHNALAEITKNMATLGVCFSACSLPGQSPLFEIAPDEMELGAGVHGEAGIEKLKMGTAKEIVALILDKIIAHLKLSVGNRVAVMINNMGGTSLMEINIIAAEIKDYLDQNQMKMERMISGHLKTSLEMQGFQICLLHLNKEHGDLWLKLLDAPTEAIGWTGGVMSVKEGDEEHGDDDTLLQGDGRKTATGPSLSMKEQEILRGSLQAAAQELVRNEELLNRLDSGCGDGDCGITLKKFGKAVLSYLETASLEYPSNVVWELSEMAETDMGGTSGGIYSLGFAAASQAIANATSNDRSSWLEAWESAMQAITKYGGAEPGDRTMLDTLYASALVYKQNLKADLKTASKKTVEAAEKGSKATATMSARAGRASYVASGYVHDEDAGARAVAIWLRAILDHIANSY
ncbi:triokinase/FMN cyclase-like [Pararge aegeria]|uniref:triokinase/FMN cyclase-like n=1 Tax=Pararge aegeria TaxID=116150 RepID=UPI0019D31AB0|nr:triokinase/FMN cyclase-like [Pararge aegeria]XP_039751129.1 triokinase/FMN cyclase-like [Pararge aegeria]XP_039751130.1 triokinase/FMN cyclase-like [Pararge aegeria]XP_039751131.1 triokinase/FMN cyclase-like [Pararge aegeria]XP_039751132.1 triokinase/FMN cyclase-like [Pararge aegeria]XP_039751133.1 triokinase/FMN cyclase-like [Pararge aegeria]XP_039751134.1 triokinase/FMN cyclase-like [Pararge aegeria]